MPSSPKHILEVNIVQAVYHASNQSERAEFGRRVEEWGAECCQGPPSYRPTACTHRGDAGRYYLARFMKHMEVEGKDYDTNAKVSCLYR